jgi:predicted AlkP superfamily pyrophosphatase or phosphodiesterase
MRRRGITTPPSVPGKRDKTIRIVRNASVRFAVALVSAASLFFVTDACRSSAGKRPPLVVVGVDGLEWRLVLQFAQEGALPNLAKLMGEGYAGKLETLDKTLSPVIWTTIATGKTPEQHGITDFSFNDETGEPHLFTSVHRKTKAFWNLLSDAGRTVHVDGWWCTWPVEALENGGTMVAQTTTRAQINYRNGRIWKGTYLKGLEKQTFPEELGDVMDAHVAKLAESADELLAAAFGSAAGPATKPSPMTQMAFDCVKQAYFGDRLFLAAAEDVLDAKRPYDVLAVYFGVTDVASHLFWRDFEPSFYKVPPSAAELADFGHVVRDAYRFADAAIGELRRKAPDADFVVLSDHGFHAVNAELDFETSYAEKSKRFESGHHTDAPPGVFIASGPSFKKQPVAATALVSDLRTVGRVADVLPTLLVLEGLPLARDLAGQPMRQVFTDAVLAAAPGEPVATYDDAAWTRDRERVRAEARKLEKNFEGQLRTMEKQSLDLLKKLGYVVDTPDPPPPPAPPPSGEKRPDEKKPGDPPK